VVNEFLKYGDFEVRNKLLKITNIIFEKGGVPNALRKTLFSHCIRKVIRVRAVIITKAWNK